MIKKTDKELSEMMNKINQNWCGTYRLKDDKTYERCTTLEWGAQLEEMSINDTKHVGRDEIKNCYVSTVWLGLDHQYCDDAPPHVFETMIKKRGEGWLDYQERYSTWDDAVEGHKRAVQWVIDGCKEHE